MDAKPSPGTVLVAGASGLVGAAAAAHFRTAGWDVVTVSRRRPEAAPESARHLRLDLRDGAASRASLVELGDVTHVVYAAVLETSFLVDGWQDERQMETNLRMLQNLLGPVAESSPLRHVSLLQGAKAYGSHLHPIRIPSRESEPRDDHRNFYWLQEDYLREVECRFGFASTILRPQLVVGGAVEVAMNVVPVIGAYAAICHAMGRPCGFPGGPSYVWEAVDTRLIAQCLEWASGSRQAVGQTFNITNGDVFEWRDLWPALMSALGVEVGEDSPQSVVRFMAEHGEAWNRIVQRHGLRAVPLARLVGQSAHAADHCFAYGESAPKAPKILSTVKLRRAGFGACVDTEESFRYWFEALVRTGVLPELHSPRR
jgi:nucleoside-diphosphate-sugar epimerase